MVDNPSPVADNSDAHAAGGAYVSGSVQAGRDFVGRDNILNVTLQVAAGELAVLSDRLFTLLATPGVQLRGQSVSDGEQNVDVRPALAHALRQFLDATPGQSQAERIRQYLLHLCVDPDFRRWQQRYVALAGGYRTAPELTPAYSALLERGEGPQRHFERVALPDIRTALEQHACLILLAQPGAGKTTVLQRIALDQALATLQGQPGARIPLFVRLAGQGVNETPQTFLARRWQEEMPGGQVDAPGELRELLRQGRLCLLVDALNEARRDGYSERLHDWRDFAAHLLPGNQLVFTCRKLDYAGEVAVQQVEIDPLTHEQIAEFAQRYLGDEAGHAFGTALHERHADLLTLAEVPYYLHMLVEVFASQGDLPPHRGRLFEHFVLQLFGRETHQRHAAPWIDPAAQHLALSELAFAMQSLSAGTQVEQAWALRTLPSQVLLPTGAAVATPPGDVLALARAASFLAGSADGAVQFTHHLLQEYFAADALLRRLARGEDLRRLWLVPSAVGELPPAERGERDPLPGPPTTGWEETTILAAGLKLAIYEAVQPINPALAARCLLESGVALEPTRTEHSRQTLLARLGNGAIHVRSRIEAGLLLGRLGDPRLPVATINGVRVIVPSMVQIAAGQATIGSGWWQHRRERQADEGPRHSVPLAAYALGRFPVTNAEYACFMAAGGYEDERYWLGGGRFWRRGDPVPGEEDPAESWLRVWRRFKADPAELDRLVAAGAITKRAADNPWRILIGWEERRVVTQVREWYPQGEVVRAPRFWQDAAFNNPSQPVAGVCWYEAMAYAAWLAAVTGAAYRLPSEPEWEWAASQGRRRYPWGNSWDADRLNSLEGANRVMRTTPVGAYPQGATPTGLFDLAGNVWEWTATRYVGYPYQPTAKLEEPDAAGLRVARGGSWAANRTMVRCGYRDGNYPRHWLNYPGFRLARASL